MAELIDTLRRGQTLRVRDVMVDKVYVLQETDTLDVFQFMVESRRVRHAPVVDDEGKVVGLLTQRDLLASSVSNLAGLGQEEQQELLRSISVAEVMTKPVTTIDPDASLEVAAAIMLERKYGCLPVVEGGKLVGILTESDFVKLTLRLLQLVKTRARTVAQEQGYGGF